MSYTNGLDDPSAYFQALLYTGNSSTQSVTFDGNSDLQPDWVWTKCRSNASDNFVFDSNRGVHKRLFTNTTAAEVDNSNTLTSFDSDGFSMGNVGGMNFSSQTYVGWGWKCDGGTTSSNTDGSITSTVQANTTAGFSIVSFTGTASSNVSVGHGLGATPDLYIIKQRNGTNSWWTYTTLIDGSLDYLELNSTAAKGDAAQTAPTSTVIYQSQPNSSTNIAYCFKSIQGYSKIGSYTGNGVENGPFVYTGFKPQWIMFKNTGAAEEWVLQDTTRNPNNPVTKNIRPDSNIAEADASNIDIDFLSNGFKNRSDQAQVNSNGVKYIYMAFASSPFIGSDGVPTTAR